MDYDYDYNTGRSFLVLPEYGRNVQKMVNHAMSIEDRTERNRAVQTIIAVMGNLNPHLRDVADFKHKLWDHLAVISEFKLDCDSPYPTPSRESLITKPRTVDYPSFNIRYKHYGKSIELMARKAGDLPEGPERKAFIESLANLMKKMYLTWNREAVSDETIFSDLRELSKGTIRVSVEDIKLPETRDILQKQQQRKVQGKNLRNFKQNNNRKK
jgi:hypothetical protein